MRLTTDLSSNYEWEPQPSGKEQGRDAPSSMRTFPLPQTTQKDGRREEWHKKQKEKKREHDFSSAVRLGWQSPWSFLFLFAHNQFPHVHYHPPSIHPSHPPTRYPDRKSVTRVIIRCSVMWRVHTIFPQPVRHDPSRLIVPPYAVPYRTVPYRLPGVLQRNRRF